MDVNQQVLSLEVYYFHKALPLSELEPDKGMLEKGSNQTSLYCKPYELIH